MLLKLVPTGSTRLPRYASCYVNKLERMSVKKKKMTEPSTWKVNLCFPRMDSRAQIRASFSEKLHQSSACRLPSFQGNIPRYTWLLLSCVQELFCPGIVFWIGDGVLFRYSVMEISSNVVRLAHSVTKQNQGETVKLISARAHSKHLLLFFSPNINTLLSKMMASKSSLVPRSSPWLLESPGSKGAVPMTQMPDVRIITTGTRQGQLDAHLSAN